VELPGGRDKKGTAQGQRTVAAGILALLLCSATFGVAASQQTAPVETSVCAVSAAPQKFDGVFVRMRAKVFLGPETFDIRDPADSCTYALSLAYADRGPGASVSVSTSAASTDRPAVALRRDSKFKEFDRSVGAEMHSRDRGDICIACARYEVTATMTGRIDVAAAGKGFGHLNAYDARFMMQSVSEVSAKDLSGTYDAATYSTTPVRFPTGYVTGRVVGPDGKPVPSIDVKAVAVGDVPGYLSEFSESADNSGKFRIEVAPGEYRVGANLTFPPSPEFPFPRTYSPSVTDQASAARFKVRDRQTITVTLRLPTRMLERRFPVRVLWPDGTAVSQANVWLAEQEQAYSVVGNSVSHTRPDGTLELVGLEGVAYLVKASIYVTPAYTPYCAEPVALSPDRPVKEEIVMRLTKTGEVCRGD
jgi:hypothetical protein